VRDPWHGSNWSMRTSVILAVPCFSICIAVLWKMDRAFGSIVDAGMPTVGASAQGNSASSTIRKLSAPAHGSGETKVSIDRQRKSIICDACIDSTFEAELPHGPFNLA
jgi:hypothetical protein